MTEPKNPGAGSGALPGDHQERMERVGLCVDGLSVGDGFGQGFFACMHSITQRVQKRMPPPPPWRYTDDTVMALSIAWCLGRFGFVEQDALAAEFAAEYGRNPYRGYGGTAHEILAGIRDGEPWRSVAGAVFGGEGSCGNGGAMRVAPVGAYFADDPERVVREARASAAVTHAHPDGQAGAVAVALAAAWVSREGAGANGRGHEVIRHVLEWVPETQTRSGLVKALSLPLEMEPSHAALVLGSGSRVVSWDTVPFCLWCVARHPCAYEDALWATISGLGDCDTTCAIVGGIVALGVGREGIPREWLRAREPLAW